MSTKCPAERCAYCSAKQTAFGSALESALRATNSATKHSALRTAFAAAFYATDSSAECTSKWSTLGPAQRSPFVGSVEPTVQSAHIRPDCCTDDSAFWTTYRPAHCDSPLLPYRAAEQCTERSALG